MKKLQKYLKKERTQIAARILFLCKTERCDQDLPCYRCAALKKRIRSKNCLLVYFANENPNIKNRIFSKHHFI